MASSILISVDNHYLAVLMSIAHCYCFFSSLAASKIVIWKVSLSFFFLTNLDKSLKLEVMSDKIIQRQVC